MSPAEPSCRQGRAGQRLPFLGALSGILGSLGSHAGSFLMRLLWFVGPSWESGWKKKIWMWELYVFLKKLILGSGQSWHSPGNRHRSPGPLGLPAQPQNPSQNPFIFPEPGMSSTSQFLGTRLGRAPGGWSCEFPLLRQPRGHQDGAGGVTQVPPAPCVPQFGPKWGGLAASGLCWVFVSR